MNAKDKFMKKAFKQHSDQRECFLTQQELAFMAGTAPEIIKQLLELDLIEPRRERDAVLFSPESVTLVKKILRLQRHLQIGFDSMALVFDLLEKIDALERRIRELEGR
jgi:chaperone modulatory protein CbpM